MAADLVCHWRDVFLERAPQVFLDPRANGKVEVSEQRIAELERMVGRLTMELDASKKALRQRPPVRAMARDRKDIGSSLPGANPV
mgnify:CR=1 FL=1